eukprot:TRINITY_DN20758_c0_g1_i1.p1 TRINITY_DN20758_c0_g1~~TRINITY_DN20758_c0_g1_i1.p1  ORF type:complete len:420 (-),score=57.57 TRINITY_DN20758_c0_g1_i1:102-1265(-)
MRAARTSPVVAGSLILLCFLWMLVSTAAVQPSLSQVGASDLGAAAAALLFRSERELDQRQHVSEGCLSSSSGAVRVGAVEDFVVDVPGRLTTPGPVVAGHLLRKLLPEADSTYPGAPAILATLLLVAVLRGSAWFLGDLWRVRQHRDCAVSAADVRSTLASTAAASATAGCKRDCLRARLTRRAIFQSRHHPRFGQRDPLMSVRHPATDTVDECVEPRAFPVRVNIYDVSSNGAIAVLNRLMAYRLSPLKFGGAFHAAVEAHGVEWSYGASEEHGVYYRPPRSEPTHRFYRSFVVGSTALDEDEFEACVLELAREFSGVDYDLLRNNCCHFCEQLIKRCGAGRLPSWVNRLARCGACLQGVIGGLTAIGLQSRGPSGAPLLKQQACT